MYKMGQVGPACEYSSMAGASLVREGLQSAVRACVRFDSRYNRGVNT